MKASVYYAFHTSNVEGETVDSLREKLSRLTLGPYDFVAEIFDDNDALIRRYHTHIDAPGFVRLIEETVITR